MATAKDSNNETIEMATVTRVLVYTGPKKWIELTLQKGNVPMNGKLELANGAGVIESGMVQWEPLPPIVAEPQQEQHNKGVYVPPPRGRVS